ncbi:hypothetical protein KJK29_28605 [Streptomyces koelreuteriae]|uniref:Uncharacterized protein n=2 Tax=Streptomyces TaxID=1883 RepID=A0ABX8FZ16_9ACTN|nr:hypothetical protein KJK29_28605 [Streptomyces koelreuteriae]
MSDMRSLSACVNLVPALAPRSPTGGITMAKNKNRDRKQQRPTERGQRADRSPAAQTEPQPEVEVAAPGDIATRKRKRSFGHN